MLPIIALAGKLVGSAVKVVKKASDKKKAITGTGFFAGRKKKAAAAAKAEKAEQLKAAVVMPVAAAAPAPSGLPHDVKKYGLFALIGVLLLIILARR